MVDFIIGILNSLMVVGSIFLVCIILIQRGRGGGLAGAFGGVGGSSAFGTKAGDVFTRVTIGVAIGWIIAAMFLVVLTNGRHHSAYDVEATTSETKEFAPPSDKGKSTAKLPAPAADQGPGEVPSPIPAPAPKSPQPAPAPPVNIPAIPDTPSSAPPASSGKSAPAPASTPK